MQALCRELDVPVAKGMRLDVFMSDKNALKFPLVFRTRRQNIQGGQAVLVDTDVVAARVAGLSFGFCLWDEVGTTCDEQGFHRQLFPNRYVYSVILGG
jgi:hypothetical protein